MLCKKKLDFVFFEVKDRAIEYRQKFNDKAPVLQIVGTCEKLFYDDLNYSK